MGWFNLKEIRERKTKIEAETFAKENIHPIEIDD